MDSTYFSWGWDYVGRWKPGDYRVAVTIGEDIIAEGSFKVRDVPLSEYNDKINNEPESDLPYARRGMYYLVNKNYDAGKKDFLKAYEKNDKCYICLSLAALCCWSQGNYQETLTLSEKSLAVGDNNPNILRDIAYIYCSSSDDSVLNGEKAIYFAQRAVDSKRSARDYDALACAHAKNGDWEKAVEMQQKAIDMYESKRNYRTAASQKARTNLELYKEHKPLREKRGQ